MDALTYGSSSQRLTCPHRTEAVPSNAVNITLLDEHGTELLASTAATKGAFSTTLSVAASVGDRSVTLTAVTSLTEGEPIVIEDAEGRSELAEVEGIDTSGKVAHLRDPLSRDYAPGSTAVSAHIYYDADISVTTTFLKATHYQAIWECSDWAMPRATMFRIVDITTDNPITFEDVRKWIPDVGSQRDDDDDPQLTDQRDAAWDLIRGKLKASQRDPDTLREAPELKVVGGLLAAAIFSFQHNRPEVAEQLGGDPVGSGGLFLFYWGATGKVPLWFDYDQDRSRDLGETKKPRRTKIGRGL